VISGKDSERLQGLKRQVIGKFVGKMHVYAFNKITK
jgi:hypothetical protein